MALVELNRNPEPHTLRRFGWIAFAVFSALAVCAFYERFWFAAGLGHARIALSATLFAIGLSSALLSIVRPRANRALYLALSALAYPIGFVLSYCVLGVLFFGIVTPLGLVLRLFGRDPLTRTLQREAPSYWVDAHPPRSRSSYFRQY